MKQLSGSRKVIHVMSAGGALANTFPIALRRYQMDQLVIVTDVTEKNAEGSNRSKIRDAIKAIEKTASSIDLEYKIIEVENESISEMMVKFMEIFGSEPDATYYFNVTGGTKPLALSLFLISVWVGGICYYISEKPLPGEEVMELKVPKMHLNDVRKNPNYENFLTLLDNRGDTDLKSIYALMQTRYIPLRTPDGKRKNTFSRPTLTKWITQLKNWGLIEIAEGRNGREKTIALTDEGKFTARFLEASSNKKS